jgi:hypothetical protein
MKGEFKITRRRFLTVGGSAIAGTLAAHSVALRAQVNPGSAGVRKRVALIATEVRKMSHAQHFIDRLLEGYGWNGRHYYPEVELVALYVDQRPDGDLSRDRSERHGLRIYPTIAEALTRGGSKLAVDGVLIIGEHGQYPRNEKGQTLYPRYRFFSEVVRVFEESGRAVPVFNDKHLSTRWSECEEMVRTSKRLNFPFLAGSSLPVTWRIPALEFELGSRLTHSLCVGYGGVDSYDFHGLETAQCMSERRDGGESGVRSVQSLRGASVWARLQSEPETLKLVWSALARSFTARPDDGYTVSAPSLEWAARHCADPVGYFYEHNDGFRTTLILANGLVSDFTYAGLRADGQIFSCQMYLPMPPAVTTLADFFNPLVHHIEQMVLTNHAPYPVERTLLTSGMTLFAVESLFRGQAKMDTPEMNVAYQTAKESCYWRT